MRPSFLWAFALCSGRVLAAPVEQRDSTGISSAQLNDFVLFSQYAGAAYCYGNVHGTPSTVECSAEGGACPEVESADATILLAFNNAGVTLSVGYVARDDINQLILVSIQGTAPSSDPVGVLTDVNGTQDVTTLCGAANTNDGCRIHAGFYTAALDVATVVTPVVTAAAKANPTYKIVATGHSLGGAVAALLGAILRNDGNIVDIYTFGQPHVGNADINNYIQNQAPTQGNNYRATHTTDVVPQLPEYDWAPGWYHYYPEFWVDTDTVPVPANDITVVTGSLYETGGNEGDINYFTGIAAQSLYFGAISSCSSDPPTS